MTEKQFTVRHLEDANVDVIWSEKTKAIPLGYTGALVLCDLLNELVDENEQLKNRILDLEELNRIYVDFLVDKGFELSDVMKSDNESTIKEATLPANVELTREKYLYGLKIGERMTENKRFTFSEDIVWLDVHCSNIFDNGKFLGTALLSDVEQLCDKLNAFQELSINDLKRIEELEKENNHLKYKLGDREEAFEVFTSEIHDKITTLIDKKIKELSYKDKVCIIPRESITVLNELKMELKL